MWHTSKKAGREFLLSLKNKNPPQTPKPTPSKWEMGFNSWYCPRPAYGLCRRQALGAHRGPTSHSSVTWRGRCQNITPVWAMNPHRACWEPWLTLQATKAATDTADICQYVYDKSLWKTPNACRRVSISGKISASHRSREEKYFLPFDSFVTLSCFLFYFFALSCSPRRVERAADPIDPAPPTISQAQSMSAVYHSTRACVTRCTNVKECKCKCKCGGCRFDMSHIVIWLSSWLRPASHFKSMRSVQRTSHF